MREISDDDVYAYVAGTLDAENARRVEEEARRDPEFGARVLLLQTFCADPPAPLAAPPLPQPPARAAAPVTGFGKHAVLLRLLSYAAVFASGMLSGWGGSALYSHLTTPSAAESGQASSPQHELLRKDNSAQRLAFTRWEPGRSTIRIEPDYVCLLNRGSIVTTDDFPAPCEIRFDWRWTDVPGDTLYPETLTVKLHASGEHWAKRPFFVLDGVEVLFQSANGQVRFAPSPEEGYTELTPDNAVPLPDREWQSVRIVDDGRKVSVYVHPRGTQEPRSPVLTGTYKGIFPKQRVAVYNREFVGARPHESHIANFRVRSLLAGMMPE